MFNVIVNLSESVFFVVAVFKNFLWSQNIYNL